MEHDRLAEVRARRALQQAGLDGSVPLQPASSTTNEVWLTPDVVVRVNRDVSPRLRREAALLDWLPAELRPARVVASGHGSGFDWLIVERLAGGPLSRAWPTMDTTQRRTAIEQLCDLLAVLHATPAPPGLAVARSPQLVEGDGPSRLVDAARAARHLDHVPASLIGLVAEAIDRHGPALDTNPRTTLIHGDLVFENLLWDGSTLTLLDFEWARPGPPDLDLDVLLRCCGLPDLHVASDYADRTRAADYAAVPGWIRHAYPELFATPHLGSRLVCYALGFDLRQVLLDPPQVPFTKLPQDHALRRLDALVMGTSYLYSLLDTVPA